MNLIATTSLLLAGSTISAFGAFFTFENGVVNTQNAIIDPEFDSSFLVYKALILPGFSRPGAVLNCLSPTGC